MKHDAVRVMTYVAVAPLDAFEVFTDESDLWWGTAPRDHLRCDRSRGSSPGRCAMRPNRSPSGSTPIALQTETST